MHAILVTGAGRSARQYHCALGWPAVVDWLMLQWSTGSPGVKDHAKLHMCLRVTNCRVQTDDSHCLYGSKAVVSADQDRVIQWHTTTCLTWLWSVNEKADDFSDILASEQARQTGNGYLRRCWSSNSPALT